MATTVILIDFPTPEAIQRLSSLLNGEIPPPLTLEQSVIIAQRDDIVSIKRWGSELSVSVLYRLLREAAFYRRREMQRVLIGLVRNKRYRSFLMACYYGTVQNKHWKYTGKHWLKAVSCGFLVACSNGREESAANIAYCHEHICGSSVEHVCGFSINQLIEQKLVLAIKNKRCDISVEILQFSLDIGDLTILSNKIWVYSEEIVQFFVDARSETLICHIAGRILAHFPKLYISVDGKMYPHQIQVEILIGLIVTEQYHLADILREGLCWVRYLDTVVSRCSSISNHKYLLGWIPAWRIIDDIVRWYDLTLDPYRDVDVRVERIWSLLQYLHPGDRDRLLLELSLSPRCGSNEKSDIRYQRLRHIYR
jgi:hypothetical protein